MPNGASENGVWSADYVGDGTLQKPLLLNNEIDAPVRVHSPPARYTEDARLDRIQGFVVLRAIIDAEGNVTSIVPVKFLGRGLTEAAMDAVAQWKYEPARRNGTPVAVFMVIRMRFSIQ